MAKTDQTENKKIFEYINQKDFFKLYSRNICLQISEIFFYYSMQELYKMRGVRFDELAINKNGFADCYGLESQFGTVYKKIKSIYNKSNSIKEYYETYALPSFKEYITFTKKMNQKYSDSKKIFSNKELLKDYKVFADIKARFIGNLWFIYLSDPVIDSMLKDLIPKHLKKIGKEDELQRYLELVSIPLRRPAIPREHESILKIASMEKGKKRDTDLKKHWEKWRWFPCYNPCDDAYGLNHYEKELAQYSIQTAKEELKKIGKETTEHEKNYKDFLKSIKDKELIKLIKMTNEICFYREHRNDLRREGLCYIRPLYEAIGKALGLNVLETCYLTREEIINSLKSEKSLISKSIAQNRIKEYAFLAWGKISALIEDKQLLSKIDQSIKDKEKQNSVLKGSPASGGIVRGRVMVVSNISKLKDFKEGEILVASMTAPDYVPAMKKSAAIVTDEGGITCHAAIVAREMKKPCVIGTKIATRVLHDGDLVEVDANKGIVRIIK